MSARRLNYTSALAKKFKTRARKEKHYSPPKGSFPKHHLPSRGSFSRHHSSFKSLPLRFVSDPFLFFPLLAALPLDMKINFVPFIQKNFCMNFSYKLSYKLYTNKLHYTNIIQTLYNLFIQTLVIGWLISDVC